MASYLAVAAMGATWAVGVTLGSSAVRTAIKYVKGLADTQQDPPARVCKKCDSLYTTPYCDWCAARQKTKY